MVTLMTYSYDTLNPREELIVNISQDALYINNKDKYDRKRYF